MKIKVGMVGGGGISNAHRLGMTIDDKFTLVAGVFSRNREKSLHIAANWYIDESRVYADYQEMITKEKNRADGIDAVSIVAFDAMHYPVAKFALENNLHVICDKPMTHSLEEALELHNLAKSKGLVFSLTHNYTGYAMIKQAALMVRNGDLGEVIIALSEHASGCLMQDNEEAFPQWRYDLEMSNNDSVIFDVGTHAHNLLRFVTGLEVAEVSAEVKNLTNTYPLHDNGLINLRLSNGASGMIWGSKVATGHEHGLRIRVYGTKASIEWHHEIPHHLTVKEKNGSAKILAQGHPELYKEISQFTRLDQGHPEGFFESFANTYLDTANSIHARMHSLPQPHSEIRHPTSKDGVLGVQFVYAVKESNDNNSLWVVMPTLDL